MLEQTNIVKVKSSPFDDVRIKLNTVCNWACKFCHQEGNPSANNLIWSNQLDETLDSLKDSLKINEVHLTGGEPTLHPKLQDFVSRLKLKKFKVRMTSNGTFDHFLLEELKEAGLSGLNISLLTLDPTVFASMHSLPKSISWAQKQIKRTQTNLKIAKAIGIDVKINCTISGFNTYWRQVLAFGEKENIPVRFQNDLYRDEAIRALRNIIYEMNGELVEIRRKSLTSRVGYVFRLPSNYLLAIKLILPVQLKSMCSACPVKNKCKEWFYTIRLEQGKPLNIRLCLHRNDFDTVMDSRKFLNSTQFMELKGLIRQYSVENKAESFTRTKNLRGVVLS